MEDSEDELKRKEVQTDLRRLYLVILDRLEEDNRGRLLDAKEVRLLSSNVLRSIRLYMRSMGWGPIRRSKKRESEGSRIQSPWIKRGSGN